MLPFEDAPYRFFPPKANSLIIALSQWANKAFILSGKNHRIASLEINGQDPIKSLLKTRKARLLLAPNHPTHSDPQILTEAFRQTGFSASFMAAYDVFLRGPFQAWIMQHIGAFSVDRDVSDAQSLKTAIAQLASGRYPLTVFPEGNVHLANDRPAPFLEGAAFIAQRAQKQLGDQAEVFVVPVAIKTSFLSDPRESLIQRMTKIASAIGTAYETTADPVAEVRRIGLLALERGLKQRGYPPPDPGEDIDHHLHRCVRTLLGRLEEKMSLATDPKLDLLGQARRVRSAVHQVRADPDRPIDQAVAATWADEAVLALRLLGYTGSYLTECPTLDRFAETTERIAEDLYSLPCEPLGNRHAYVTFCQPLRVRDHLTEAPRSRDAAKNLTQNTERAIQDALAEINQRNRYPGGMNHSTAFPT